MCHAQFRVYTLRFSFPLKELLSKIAENYYENIHDAATFFKNGYDSWIFFFEFLTNLLPVGATKLIFDVL